MILGFGRFGWWVVGLANWWALCCADFLWFDDVFRVLAGCLGILRLCGVGII